MAGFPNVPFAPGVPAIPRAPGALPAAVDLLVSDALSILGLTPPQQWGLFLGGEPAVTAESVVSFEFKKGYAISDFPVEEGSFESYNKVQRPFDVRLRFATGGTAADRQELLQSVDAAVASLDLYDAVTPEASYENLNPVHYDYRRTAQNGVGLLVVDVFCEQVRVSASSSFTSTGQGSSTTQTSATGASTTAPAAADVKPITNTNSVSAAPQVNDGTVYPVTPTPAQQAAVDQVTSQSMLPW